MSAIDINARPSDSFATKLAQTTRLLQQAALDYAPTTTGAAPRVTLACSLGAEDVVLAHLVNQLQLNIGIFVLETGQLHAETLSLLERLKANSRAPVEVFKPVNEAVVQFVAREGKDAMYKSIDLRKACCNIRKMEPLSRALAGKDAWITGLRREQSATRAEVPF
ncbi:MAG TPA: phosphoadenosine phosphosulfate reductase family protein, partial [Rhodoferax sp.]